MCIISPESHIPLLVLPIHIRVLSESYQMKVASALEGSIHVSVYQLRCDGRVHAAFYRL